VPLEGLVKKWLCSAMLALLVVVVRTEFAPATMASRLVSTRPPNSTSLLLRHERGTGVAGPGHFTLNYVRGRPRRRNSWSRGPQCQRQRPIKPQRRTFTCSFERGRPFGVERRLGEQFDRNGMGGHRHDQTGRLDSDRGRAGIRCRNGGARHRITESRNRALRQHQRLGL